MQSCEKCGYQEIEGSETEFMLRRCDLPNTDVFFIFGTRIPVVSDNALQSMRQYIAGNTDITQLKVI
jgi:hypothetical protein